MAIDPELEWRNKLQFEQERTRTELVRLHIAIAALREDSKELLRLLDVIAKHAALLAAKEK